MLIYKICLDTSYVYVVSPYLSWTPNKYPYDLASIKLAESYIMAFICYLFIRNIKGHVSRYLLLIFLLVSLMPTLSLYGLLNGPRKYMYFLVATYLIICLSVTFAPKIQLPKYNVKPWICIYFLLSSMTIIVSYYFLAGGKILTPLEFIKYQQMVEFRRSVYRGILDATFLDYLVNWCIFVFNPLILSWGLYKKSWFITVVSFIITLIFFGMTGRRTALMAFPFIIGVYLLNQSLNTERNTIVSAILLVMVVSIYTYLTGGVFVASALLDSSIFGSARLNFAYYEFFSNNEFIYMSNNSVPIPAEYQYEDSYAKVVGQQFYGTDTVASAGWTATSYMHFGFTGMLVYGVIISCIMLIIESPVVSRPILVAIPPLTISFYVLYSAQDLPALLLTTGLLPLMSILYITNFST